MAELLLESGDDLGPVLEVGMFQAEKIIDAARCVHPNPVSICA